MSRNCPMCGAQVELAHLKETGQRVLVNPGFVPLFLGPDSGGGIVMGRVPHHQTCPKAQGIRTVDGLARIANDGVWKSKEQEEEVDPRE